MKNNKIVLGLSALLLATSLLTTACGKEVKVSSKAVVGFESGEIKANDFYKDIKENNISRLVDMIDIELLKKKYKNTEEETKNVKDQIKSIKEYYKDDATFKQVIAQYFGATDEKNLEEILRLEYKREQAVNNYIEKKLTDGEIKDYYDKNIYGDMTAKHILITVDSKDDATDEEKQKANEKALNTAKDIIKQLDEGKKFDDLAKKHSKDEATASKGGDLGSFEYDSMVEDFSKACAKLEVNAYSKEPVKTKYGYHIILKVKQEDKPALKKVKSKIKKALREEKLTNNPEKYYEALKAIREDNGITWNDSKLKDAYNDFMEKLISSAKTNNQKS